MVAYRLYCLDGGGKIDLAEWIDAGGDADAVRQARLLKPDALKCEIWQGHRLVASLGPGDPGAADVAPRRHGGQPPQPAEGGGFPKSPAAMEQPPL